jgi:zinc/manganese transport system substrate-binding protein
MQIRFFLTAVLAAVSSFVFLAPPALATEPIRVVASFSILGDLVHNVGGNRVTVSTLVGANGDAHSYQPRPSDSEKIKKANLVIINGLGFETWADRLIKASNYKGKRLVAAKGVSALRGSTEHAGHSHGHNHAAHDPHAWQDMENVKKYVTNIRDALTEVDPEGGATYQANTEAYLSQLVTLHSEIKATFASIPNAQKKVITSHDALSYFGDAYGIVFHSPQGMSTDAQASAKNIATLIKQIKEEKITALFVENMSDQRILQQIASETAVKIGGTLYADALASTGEASTYIGMMRHNTRLIAEALR